MLIPKDMEICLEVNAKAVGLKDLIYTLAGIVLTESSAQWDATRHEPAYRWVVNAKTGKAFRKLTAVEAKSKTPPKDFPGLPGVSTPQKEWDDQRTSFGPMQIMGAEARELGFTGDLTKLTSPAGIEYGVKHFKNLYTRFFGVGGLQGVIEAYNKGSPDVTTETPYAVKVRRNTELVKKQMGG